MGGIREESGRVCRIFSKCSRSVLGKKYNGLQSEGTDGIDSILESLLQFHGSIFGSRRSQKAGVTIHVDLFATRQTRTRIQKVSKMEEILENYKEKR